jgi:hypothetical protein
MMEHNDIYRILENLDAAQRSVKQLPALFRPADTSPQLSGPYPGQNATRGYLVGEGQEETNPMAQAVTRRIVDQHPEWITRYGVEFLMQVIDDVTEGEGDWEEIGSSDVSAYVNMVGDQLRDRGGSRDEMQDRSPFEPGAGSDTDEFGNPIKHRARHLARRGMRQAQGLGEAQETATEDVLATMKRRLGDYLQDVATAIKKDPDLVDQLPTDIDQIKAVKTMKTDDGHEIKITGNEDDGFRISIKNKESNTKFANLDEATMAVEMFCARRRKAAESADYIEEA